MATPNTYKKLFISGPLVGIDIEILSTVSILQLKQRIKEITKVAEDRQTLFFNGVCVDNNNYILRDIVHLQCAVMMLKVTLLPGNPGFVIVAKSQGREDDHITVKERQSVYHLRNEIAARWGIFPPVRITLFRFAHLMEDWNFLFDYFICEGAEIHVSVCP